LFITVLGADFEHINIDKYMGFKKILLDIGIETIDIWTGHGVQALILYRFLNNQFLQIVIEKIFLAIINSKDIF